MVIPVLLSLLLIAWTTDAQFNSGLGTTIQVGTTQNAVTSGTNAVAVPGQDNWSCNCRRGGNTITMALPDSTLGQYGLSQYIIRQPQSGVVSVQVQQPGGFGVIQQVPQPAPVPVPTPQPTPAPVATAPTTSSVTSIGINIKQPEEPQTNYIVPPVTQQHVAVVPPTTGYVEHVSYRLPPMGVNFKWGNRLCKCEDALLSGLPQASLATLVSYDPVDTSEKTEGTKAPAYNLPQGSAVQSLKPEPDLSASNIAQTFNPYQNVASGSPVQTVKPNVGQSNINTATLLNQFSRPPSGSAAQSLSPYPISGHVARQPLGTPSGGITLSEIDTKTLGEGTHLNFVNVAPTPAAAPVQQATGVPMPTAAPTPSTAVPMPNNVPTSAVPMPTNIPTLPPSTVVMGPTGMENNVGNNMAPNTMGSVQSGMQQMQQMGVNPNANNVYKQAVAVPLGKA